MNGLYCYTNEVNQPAGKFESSDPDKAPTKLRLLLKCVLADWFGVNISRSGPIMTDPETGLRRTKTRPILTCSNDHRPVTMPGGKVVRCNVMQFNDNSLEHALKRARARLVVLATERKEGTVRDVSQAAAESFKPVLYAIEEMCAARNVGDMEFTRGRTRAVPDTGFGRAPSLLEPFQGEDDDGDLEDMQVQLDKRQRVATIPVYNAVSVIPDFVHTQEANQQQDEYALNFQEDHNEEVEDEVLPNEVTDDDLLNGTLEGSRKRKRNKDAAGANMKTRYDILQLAWPDICKRYVGPDPYSDMAAPEFVGNLLTRTMKLRTRRSVAKLRAEARQFWIGCGVVQAIAPIQ
jgi:hypothetical protein